MRIAFDVKGTIEGPKQKFVLGLMEYLKEAGHEIIVWSNSLSYAMDAVRDHELSCPAVSKRALYDIDNDVDQCVDLAIDDDSSQSWLAAKRFIWVHDLPGAMGGIKNMAESITNQRWDDIKCQTNEHLARLRK
jgi:hypothetical protein